MLSRLYDCVGWQDRRAIFQTFSVPYALLIGVQVYIGNEGVAECPKPIFERTCASTKGCPADDVL